MSRFRKLSHTIWHCQYHIVWVPKYRFRILVGAIRDAVHDGIQAICGFAGCEVVELNVQKDHVHPFGNDTPEGIDFGLNGSRKRSNGDEGVPAVSRIAP